MESEDHMCPQCKEVGVSPDSLIPNTYLRKLVINFENETGYIKPARRSSGGTGDVGKTVSQNKVAPQLAVSGASVTSQQNSMASRPSPTSQYSGAPTTAPMSASRPSSQQLPTSIPASLIGLPPHVIKAHLREMEKARQSANQPAQPKSQPYATTCAVSTNSYPQSSHRMSDSYTGHQSQPGMMMSQRPSVPPMLSSSTPMSRTMT